MARVWRHGTTFGFAKVLTTAAAGAQLPPNISMSILAHNFLAYLLLSYFPFSISNQAKVVYLKQILNSEHNNAVHNTE